jgi:DNA primase
VHRLTRVTDGSLYNYGEHELSHKLLALEDMDGLGEYAVYALRELQSSHRLSSSTSGKDALGNSKGRMTIVKGPIASLACTTKGSVYEDNASRCLTVAVDESATQTKRIIAHQNAKEAGLWNQNEAEKAKGFVRRLARLIQPLEVLNPYAQKVGLPEGIRKERRLNGIYHILVRQVALWHQYQRKKDSSGRILASPQDLRMASELMFESMVLKVDELDGQLRGFFESLKEYLKDEETEFAQREIRQAIGISKTQLHRHLQALLELEYIRITGGHINRGYRYQISYWDDNEALRKRIKSHLESQIDEIEKGNK